MAIHGATTDAELAGEGVDRTPINRSHRIVAVISARQHATHGDVGLSSQPDINTFVRRVAGNTVFPLKATTDLLMPDRRGS